MAITRETFLKIAAVANDSAASEEERAVAQMRLREAYRRSPELLRVGHAPSSETPEAPSFTNVATPESEPYDSERDSFFDLKDRGRSTRNPNNLVHVLGDDTVITVFPNRKRPDCWSWCVNRNGTPAYSRHPHPSELAAMRDCWTIAIAPRRKRGRP
jgi:hypothetical protein